MATCATDNMEGMVLIFERVYFGSLYNYLHEKVVADNTTQQQSNSYLV